MADALTALVQLVPGIASLAKNLVAASDAAQRNAQLIEFQNAVIGFQGLIASVQQENATLLRQKNEAEAALERMKDWEGQKKRYKLAAPFAGCLVQALQKDMSNGEPAHYLCAACFEKGQKSILQSEEAKPRKEGGRTWSSFNCQNPACKAVAFTGYANAVAPQYFEDIKQRS